MLIKGKSNEMSLTLDTARFDKQYKKAQKYLNMQVVADCTPLIPFQQGQLRSQVRYPDGIYGDTIEWYAPYAHYMYEGELYLTDSGSPYAKEGETKKATGTSLNYHTAGTSDHWFEYAKNTHGNEWKKRVRQIAGGGI